MCSGGRLLYDERCVWQYCDLIVQIYSLIQSVRRKQIYLYILFCWFIRKFEGFIYFSINKINDLIDLINWLIIIMLILVKSSLNVNIYYIQH